MIKNRKESQDDILENLVFGAGKVLFFGGILAAIVGLAFLLLYFQRFTGSDPNLSLEQGRNLVETFGKVFLYGALASGIGACFLFWGEEVLGVLMLLLAAAIYFAPMYVPSMLAGDAQTTSPIPGLALQKIQMGGMAFGLIALFATGWEIYTRVQNRIKYGSKADSLKFGKGVKEEDDIQLVFLGKCWQLPYCRKFVREKCPIYHARRTCWKERVGCMCEEKVIANAMMGTTISKDSLSAAKFIPYNKNLPNEAKAERCRQCVIYNERQRQKYKVALPLVLLFGAASYVLFREPIKHMLIGVTKSADRFLGNASLSGDSTGALNRMSDSGFMIFQESLAIALMIMLLAYLLKLTEFVIFKLKL